MKLSPCSDAGLKASSGRDLNNVPLFGRSVSGENRTSRWGLSRLNGLFISSLLIGSVNREQRLTRATTRTTFPATIPEGWCSRPRPVNRLQATGQPKSCNSRRRVMRGGSKAKRLAPKEQRTDSLCTSLCRESSRFHQRNKVQMNKSEYGKYITSEAWTSKKKQFKKTPMWRNGRCFVCTNSGIEKHVHHLRYTNLGNERMSDLRILCAVCHAAAHTQGSSKRMRSKFYAHASRNKLWSIRNNPIKYAAAVADFFNVSDHPFVARLNLHAA